MKENDRPLYTTLDCPADNYSEWNRFVQQNSGNYCHLYGWRHVLENSYRLKTFYLKVMCDSEWIGIIPLALMPGFSKLRAVSIPYCNYGGLLVQNGYDPLSVWDAVLPFLEGKGIRQIEVRELGRAGDASSTNEVTLMLNLPELSDSLWKSIGAKVRNQVRKAERSGLEVQWGREQVTDLYGIYAENMGRLGTPVHARAFVDEITTVFGDQADVLTVKLQGRAIAAMLVLKFGDTWIDPIASSLFEFRNLNPNMLLYWEALKQAVAAGACCFDFGRSQLGSGTHKFKRQWGATEIPLNYHSYENGVRVASASTDIYRGSKAATLAKVWSKLPGSIQLQLGPKIRRYIP